MKLYLLFLLFPLLVKAQQPTFEIEDVILVRIQTAEQSKDFLQSKGFVFVEKAKQTDCYAINYKKNKAKLWLYKHESGKVKLAQSGYPQFIYYLKDQIKDYQTQTIPDKDGWIEIDYQYKNLFIYVRENDVLKKYEFYIQ
jgi:hypothetical protein